MIIDYDTVETNGIHITASQPVAVYALDYASDYDLDGFGAGHNSTAFTGYPTTLLGTNYCVMARADSLPYTPQGGYYSQLAIVATADTTTVTIKPSATANLEGHTNSYTEILQQGQTYQINSWDDTDDDYTNDVTGTWIASDKPVAVFAGANTAYVPDTNTLSANPLLQEQLPVNTWGTNALAMSFAGRTNGDSYRVLAAYSNTVVTITGTVVTITNEPDDGVNPWGVTTSNEVLTFTLTNAGQFYDIIVDGPVVFQASQPIQVAQFANGNYSDDAVNSGGVVGEGDPCEILLPPTGHYLTTNVVITPIGLDSEGNPFDFDEHFLSIIVAQPAISNTLVDGSHIASTNFVAIGTSGYYGTQITVTNTGVHTVTSSQPVGVEVYGWGEADAYGYFGGIVK
jgi:hypothetical protein